VEQSGGEAVLFLQAARQRPDRRAREVVLHVLVRRWDKETAERARTGKKPTAAEH
jgi:hypothetical protein